MEETMKLKQTFAIALIALFSIQIPAFSGTATFYKNSFDGKKMANGKRYRHYLPVAAHPSYPIGTRLKVCNTKTKRCTNVTVTDRCSCSLDLSRGSFKEIGKIKQGRIPVSISKL
jgi:rare lipoprotein A